MFLFIKRFVLTSTFIALSVVAIQAQEETQAKVDNSTATTPTERAAPVFSEYKGVKIGLAANDVRVNLEKYLKAKGDTQDLLVVSDNETAQVFYDDLGKVRAVSIDYLAKNSSAPTAAQVFGKEIAPRADGSVYALERYPELGYWVSYNRTAGENPIVTVTIQAMR